MNKMRCLGIALSLGLAFAGALCAGISPTSLPNGILGASYSVQLTESEQFSVAPVTWSYTGNLPPGLALNTSTTSTTTTISGAPTTPGSYTFTVAATYNESANTTDTQSYTVYISSNCTPTLVPASPLPSGDVNVVYTQISFSVSGCAGAQYTYMVQQLSFAPVLSPQASI